MRVDLWRTFAGVGPPKRRLGLGTGRQFAGSPLPFQRGAGKSRETDGWFGLSGQFHLAAGAGDFGGFVARAGGDVVVETEDQAEEFGGFFDEEGLEGGGIEVLEDFLEGGAEARRASVGSEEVRAGLAAEGAEMGECGGVLGDGGFELGLLRATSRGSRCGTSGRACRGRCGVCRCRPGRQRGRRCENVQSWPSRRAVLTKSRTGWGSRAMVERGRGGVWREGVDGVGVVVFASRVFIIWVPAIVFFVLIRVNHGFRHLSFPRPPSLRYGARTVWCSDSIVFGLIESCFLTFVFPTVGRKNAIFWFCWKCLRVKVVWV